MSKTILAFAVVAILAGAAIWASLPRSRVLWEVDSALKAGSVSNQEIVSIVRKQAEAGDAKSQFNLAVLYEKGLRDALPKDLGQALGWYDRAAQQGHAEARRVLDAYVKSGLIAAPDFRGKWMPHPTSGKGDSSDVSHQK